MSKEIFKKELEARGIEVFEPDSSTGKIYFEYTIPAGINEGLRVFIGMYELNAYPASIPSKVNVKEIDKLRLYPQKNIQESAFGSDWKYWSRSFNNWGSSKRDINVFFDNLKHIFYNIGNE